ncbi:MAG: IPTL-CTERM sorting domain-containing protein [Acidobacteria bacterium]|nr:IPTL-CTERM sorting domain-containing protein [Acidobacteriota bacterium]
MNYHRPLVRVVLFVIFVMGTFTWGQSAQTGIRVTVTDVNTTLMQGTIDVTVFDTTSKDAIHPRDRPVDGGSIVIGSSFYGIPAIDWGDGNTTPQTSIPLVTPGNPATFRGSFSHTYPDTSARTITAFSGCCVGYNSIITGNIYSSTGSGFVFIIYNTAALIFGQQVPALSGYALAIFSGLLVLGGLWFMRRRTA